MAKVTCQCRWYDFCNEAWLSNGGSIWHFWGLFGEKWLYLWDCARLILFNGRVWVSSFCSKRSFVAALFTAETCHHSTLMIKYDDSSIFVLKDRETRSIKVLRMCAKYDLTLEKRPEIFTTLNLISETLLILQKYQDRLWAGPQKPEKMKYYEKFRPKIKILYQKGV